MSAPLFTKMHTDPQFSFSFQTLLCKLIPIRNFSVKFWYRQFKQRHNLTNDWLRRRKSTYCKRLPGSLSWPKNMHVCFLNINLNEYVYHLMKICYLHLYCPLIIFHSFVDVTMAFTGERLQILTYARHLWALSSESSLECHINCDCPAYGTGAVTTCFNELGLSLLGFEHPFFHLRNERSNRPHVRRNICL